MTARRPSRPRRQTAEDRRRDLVEATIRSLKKRGHDGLSVRSIAAEAGVSIGLINHHFPNKNRLVAESYRHFSKQLEDAFRKAVGQAPANPRARLHAFIEAVFSRPSLDPRVLTAWVVFWGLFRSSPQMRLVHGEGHRGYGALLPSLLTDYQRSVGRFRISRRLAETGLAAMLDGLWLEWCLDPKHFRPREAVRLCESWIDSLAVPRRR
jgi:TetR/AcrR family transcriptional repressor of bet genes